MSNQLNDPMPILLTDRLSAPNGGAVLRAVDADPDAGPDGEPGPGTGRRGSSAAHDVAARLPDRLLDSVFGPLTLRSLVPADVGAHADFLQALGERGRRMRGFSLPAALAAGAAVSLPAARAPDAGAAGAAVQLRLGLAPVPEPAQPARGNRGRLLGELCISIERSRVAAEFALAVRPALQGHGLGRLLIHCLLDLCLVRRVTLACASVPADSPAMLALAHGCGFQILRAADGSAQLALMLRPRGIR